MLKIKAFDRCVFELNKLPGIGRKTAVRLALHLIKVNKKDIESLASSLLDLKSMVKICSVCYGLSEEEVCSICSDKSRNSSTLCVVEEAKDIFIIENLGRYNGLYHVLGGKIAPIDGVGPDELNIKQLLEKIASGLIQEIIIATNPDVEGETTAIYLHKIISKQYSVKVTRIASGVPIGGHLEYSDEITILKSIENRREMLF